MTHLQPPVSPTQADRDHPCFGIFPTSPNKRSHRHWFANGELMPTCARCGTEIDRQHNEVGPVRNEPPSRLSTIAPAAGFYYRDAVYDHDGSGSGHIAVPFGNETERTRIERRLDGAPDSAAIAPGGVDREAKECGAVSEDAIAHLEMRSQLNRAIYKAIRDYRMGNMADEDGATGYPLVDLMSNPAPSDIGTGEMEMVALSDEIEAAILSLPQAPAGGEAE